MDDHYTKLPCKNVSSKKALLGLGAGALLLGSYAYTSIEESAPMSLVQDLSVPREAVSKNLFDMQPQGYPDPEQQFKVDIWDVYSDPDGEQGQPAKTAEDVAAYREMTDFIDLEVDENPRFKASFDACHQQSIMVPMIYGNDAEVPVYVHTPKSEHEGPRAAFVYVHGGGMMGGLAKQTKSWGSHQAILADVVVFNVEYRRIPEATAEQYTDDVYSTLKYVYDNAAEFGVDPTKIALGGESAGGLISEATAVKLVQKGESGMVKLLMANVALALGHLWFDPLEEQNYMERASHYELPITVYNGAGHSQEAMDKAIESRDPLIFADKAEPEILALFPPTVIIEGEFDPYNPGAELLSERLDDVDRLLEFMSYPGSTHMFHVYDFEKAYQWEEDYKVIMNEYLK